MQASPTSDHPNARDTHDSPHLNEIDQALADVDAKCVQSEADFLFGRNPRFVRQKVISHESGVKLTIDRLLGAYRLSFDKAVFNAVGRDFFETTIKPYFDESYEVQKDPEIRIGWRRKGEQWVLPYRLPCDDSFTGTIVKDGDKKYANFHAQVGLVAHEIADILGQKLADKLGLNADRPKSR